MAATVNFKRAADGTAVGEQAGMVLLPRGQDAPDLFGPQHVDLVVFFHRAPGGVIAVDAAVPGVPALRGKLVAKSPLDRQSPQTIAVLIGDFAYLLEGIENDVWGWGL